MSVWKSERARQRWDVVYVAGQYTDGRDGGPAWSAGQNMNYLRTLSFIPPPLSPSNQVCLLGTSLPIRKLEIFAQFQEFTCVQAVMQYVTHVSNCCEEGDCCTGSSRQL